MKKLSVINQRFIEAARDNQLNELKNLLSQGADIHANDEEALREAALNDHLEIVKYLITQGANIHAKNDYILKKAAKNGDENITALLNSALNKEKLINDANVKIIKKPPKKALSHWLAPSLVENTPSKAMAYAAQLVEKDLAVVAAALKTLPPNSPWLATSLVENTPSRAMEYAAQLVEKDLAVVSAALKTLPPKQKRKC